MNTFEKLGVLFVCTVFLMAASPGLINSYQDYQQKKTVEKAGYAKILSVEKDGDNAIMLTLDADGKLINVSVDKARIEGNINSLVGSYIKYDEETKTYVITKPEKADVSILEEKGQ